MKKNKNNNNIINVDYNSLNSKNNLNIKRKPEELHLDEFEYQAWDGCCMLFVAILTLPTIIIPIIICGNLVTIEPNEAYVITFCGKYKGTLRKNGYFFIMPCSNFFKISLRQQNLDGKTLTVNDKRGNPIEIAMVLVWRIVEPVKAIFSVQNYHSYVILQSEAALRYLATSYSYDHGGDESEVTLLNGSQEVNNFLKKELNERLQSTGIEVDEARINHLMYDKQISNVMLKRQQAEATIAARRKIVDGATYIVRDTINGLSKDINFNEDQKAKMASNLIIVLCSETQAQPLMHLNNVQ